MDYSVEKVRWDELKEGDTFLVNDQRQGIFENRVLEVLPRGSEVTEIRAVALMTMEESNLVSLNHDEYYRATHTWARKVHA